MDALLIGILLMVALIGLFFIFSGIFGQCKKTFMTGLAIFLSCPAIFVIAGLGMIIYSVASSY